MKSYLSLIVFCGIIAIALSQISAPSDYLDPEHPGKCLFEGHSVDTGIHENLDPATCYRFSCLEGAKGTIEGCGSVAAPPDCKLGDYEDVSKPYPDCCKKKIEC